MKPKIIAEIGWNHVGNMILAKEMISAAIESGADIIKFQTWSVKRLKPGAWDDDGRRQIYEKAELTKERHIDLINYTHNKGAEFLSTAFSITDAKLLKDLGIKEVKISSFDSRNKKLINYCNDNFDYIYISTGTSNLDELVESTIDVPDNKITLLHCVSSYPCKPEWANLKRIDLLRDIKSSVGYSDHTFGVEITKMALEYDVDVLEKHFTIDHNLPGRDNKFAILPEELKDLRTYIDIREFANSGTNSGYQECEVVARETQCDRFNKEEK